MAFCLIKPLADAFKQALRDGRINPEKLASMSSAERRAFLSEIVGKENAKEVNALFEKKMLVKDFQRGVIAWAKEVARLKPEVKRNILDKIEKIDERILNPETEKAFLEDLAEKKLGIEVTFEEAKKVAEISKTLVEKRQKYNPETQKWSSERDRLSYGASRVEMLNLLDEARDPYSGMGVKESAKAKLADTKALIKESPFFGTVETGKGAIKSLADLSVSMVATLDNSFLGRQGLKVLMTHPTRWANGAVQSFKNFGMELGGKNAMDALRADILSRPNAMNGNYELAKIIDLNEEAFPTSFPEKVPGLGRVFKGSEAAFKGSALRMRADLFDLVLEQMSSVQDSLSAKLPIVGKYLKGTDATAKPLIQDVGMLVNGLTAKGYMGERGGNPFKGLLWAPKMLKANFDVLTAYTFSKKKISPAVRLQAWKNLIKIVGVTSVILSVAKALDPESVELDPTSSDFGKIKYGPDHSQRTDISGGMGSLITLASRLLTGRYKSSTTGDVKEYGTEFGMRNRFDAVVDFLTNKVTPPLHVMIDLLKGQTSDGKAPTVANELMQLYVPLPARQGIEFVKDPSWDRGVGVLFDFFGLSGNNYLDSNKNTNLIPENKHIKNDDFISMVKTYGEALGTDPETAFNRIFTGQRIRRVDNGTVIVERMPLAESQEIKKKAGGDNPTMKLDHTVPLQLGGSNDDSNLKMVTTSEWSSYTAVENHLGKLLRENKISKDKAQSIIKDFKAGKITREKALAEKGVD